jgi:hypothetical protein
MFQEKRGIDKEPLSRHQAFTTGKTPTATSDTFGKLDALSGSRWW